MELKIEAKNEQPLMARTEVTGRMGFESVTPSRGEVARKLAEAMKAKEGEVMVTKISTDFGQKAATVTAHVYKTKEDADKFAGVAAKKRHEKSSQKQEEAKPEQKTKAPAEAKEEKKETAAEKKGGPKTETGKQDKEKSGSSGKEHPKQDSSDKDK